MTGRPCSVAVEARSLRGSWRIAASPGTSSRVAARRTISTSRSGCGKKASRSTRTTSRTPTRRLHEHHRHGKQQRRRLDRLLRARPLLGRRLSPGWFLVPAGPDVRPEQHSLRWGFQVQRPAPRQRRAGAEQLHQRRGDQQYHCLQVAVGESSSRSRRRATASHPPRAPVTRRARRRTGSHEPSPWPYTPKANEGSPGTFPISAFFEGGINITRLVPDATCFSGFLAETRSSTPFDARLKDFVGSAGSTSAKSSGREDRGHSWGRSAIRLTTPSRHQSGARHCPQDGISGQRSSASITVNCVNQADPL